MKAPTNDEVFSKGNQLNDWAIDQNEMGETESNAGREYLIEYEGKKYIVQTNWDDEVRRPNSKARPAGRLDPFMKE